MSNRVRKGGKLQIMLFKKFIALLLACVIGANIAPWGVLAEESSLLNSVEQISLLNMKVTSDKAAVYSLEDDSVVGYLYQDFEIEAESIDNLKVIFSLNNDSYYMDRAEVQVKESIEDVVEELIQSPGTATSYKVIEEQAILYAEEENNSIEVGELFKGFVINPVSENETEIFFEIGKSSVSINKSSLELLTVSGGTETKEGNETTEAEDLPLESGNREDTEGLNIEIPVEEANVLIEAEEVKVLEETKEQSLNLPDTSVEKEPADNLDQSKTTGTTTLTLNSESFDEVVFSNDTKYFKVNDNLTPVYQNNQIIAYLNKDQEFPRVEDSGNWHYVKIGTGYGYVWKASTTPSDGASIQNLKKIPISSDYFISLGNAIVYDTSSGERIPFAEIPKGVAYPIIGGYNKFSNWYEVDVLGRIGYVMKTSGKIEFKPSDNYFKVKYSGTPIFINKPTGGSLEAVHLHEGQVFKRDEDYGNWHKVTIGNEVGFVWEEATEPATGASIKNHNTGQKISNYSFRALENLTVYDTSSGSRVAFATIKKNIDYPVIGGFNKYSNWYEIDIDGRIGYVNKSGTAKNFLSTDKLFQVIYDNVYAVDSEGEQLIKLTKNEIYPRVADYGNWHKVKYQNGYAFVWKNSTQSVQNTELEGLNSTPINEKNTMRALGNVPIVDYNRNVIGELKNGQSYQYIRQVGSWYEFDVLGRIGYVNKSYVQVGPVFNYTNYNITLENMVQKHWLKDARAVLAYDNYGKPYIKPVDYTGTTDTNYDSYVSKDYINVDAVNTGTVYNANILNVRGGPSTSYWIVGWLKIGDRVTITGQTGHWYKISFQGLQGWRNADINAVRSNLDPNSFTPETKDYYQFLKLSQPANLNANEVNDKILSNKGILQDKAQTFIDAAEEHKINEIYLISHALLETGNGTSSLANGILVDTVNGQKVEPKVVYNMFGIGANDGAAERLGSERAYKEGWFTPELAIIGGAKFIGENYIHHPTYKQDTLYEMRWNPLYPGTHVYATDIGWAYKQVYKISQLYDLIDTYELTYDIPVYLQ
jgi:mannosyl-glycoprotein endo-beta-N-acetylglucosaminidase